MSESTKGVIFDMDGTLFDTERLFITVHSEISNEWQLPLPKGFFIETVGVAPEQMKILLQDNIGIDFDYEHFKEERDRRLSHWISTNGLPIMQGAKDAVEQAKKMGYKLAVASSSSTNTINKYLQIAGWDNQFDAVVGRNMIVATKPAPDCYLAASKALALPPENCIAVEDSIAGVESAYSAGCKTIMIPSLIAPTEKTIKQCYAILRNMDELIPILQ